MFEPLRSAAIAVTLPRRSLTPRKPVVRHLGAGIAELGRDAAIDGDPSDCASAVEVPTDAAVARPIEVIRNTLHSWRDRLANTEDAVDVPRAVRGDPGARVRRIRLRAIVDRTVNGERPTVVARHRDPLAGRAMEVVVCDQHLPWAERQPWLIRLLGGGGAVDRAPAGGVAPSCGGGWVSCRAAVDVTALAAAENRAV